MNERTTEQIVVVAAANDEVLRIPFTVPADGGFRELGESNAEVDVGAGIVGAPTLTASFSENALVHEAAEMELAVSDGRGRKARRLAAPATPHVGPDLTVRGCRRQGMWRE